MTEQDRFFPDGSGSPGRQAPPAAVPRGGPAGPTAAGGAR